MRDYVKFYFVTVHDSNNPNYARTLIFTNQADAELEAQNIVPPQFVADSGHAYYILWKEIVCNLIEQMGFTTPNFINQLTGVVKRTSPRQALRHGIKGLP